MSMYLPNSSLHPTGYEPAEYLDAPTIGDGHPAERVDAPPSSAPTPTPIADTPVPQVNPENGGLLVPDRRGWLVRLVTSGRTDPAPGEGRVSNLARRPPRWRGALGLRHRR